MVNDIPQWLLTKWQGIADLIAELLNIPAALIMRTENEYMEVFVSSKSDNNPYKPGDKEKWYGLYCETVIKSQDKLLIPNALKNKHWDKNPDIGLGMIAYLGYPINYPDNTPFGTICVLDVKENSFSSVYEKLLIQFKGTIENDLLLLETFKAETRKQDETITEQYQNLKRQNEELQSAEEELREQNQELQATEEELTASNDELRNNIELLSESEKMFSSTVNDLLVGVVVHAADSSIILSNPQAQHILGLSYDQMRGKKAVSSTWNFVHEDESVMKVEDYPISKVLSTGKGLLNYVLGVMRPDRKEITWVTVNAVPVFSNKKEFDRVIINFMDITERKQFEITLKDRNESLQAAEEELQASNDALYELHEQLKERFEELQSTEEELRERHEELQAAEEELVASNDALKENITQLEESEDRFKALHNASFGGIAIHDKGIILECNKGLSDLTGYSVDELVGMNGLLLIAERFREIVMNNIKSKYEKPNESIGVRKNGEEYPIRTEASEIPYKGRQVRVVELRDITEQKKAEEEILSERNRSLNILQGTNAGTWEWNIETNEVLFNERYAEIIGYKLNEIAPSFEAWRNSVNPKDIEVANSLLEHHFAGKNDFFEAEFRQKHKKGHWVWVAARGKVIKWTDNGKPKFMSGTHLDINKRKNAELDLISNENQLQIIFDNSPAIMMLLNEETQIIKVNRTGLIFTGRKPDEVIRKLPGDIFSCVTALQTDLGCGYGEACKICKIRRTVLKTISTGKSLNKVEAELSTINNGVTKKLTVLISTATATTAPELTYLVTIDDITDRKKTEQTIVESEKRFRTIIDSANDAIFIADTKTGLIVDANKKAEQIIGKSRNELIGMHQSKLHPAEEAELIKKKFEQDIEHAGKDIIKEINLQHISGEIIPTELSPAFFKLDDGKGYLVGFFRDIRKRKEAEKALADSFVKYKTLAEYTYDWEYWKAPNGEYIYNSPSCKRITGYSAAEFDKKANLFNTIICQEDRGKWQGHLKKVEELVACKTPIELRIKTKLGKVKWINHVCQPVFDDHGIFLGNRGTNRDITQRKQSELALEDSETRFKQLANFTQEGIILHKNGIIIDVNKAMFNITGYVQKELVDQDIVKLFVQEKDYELVYGKIKQNSIKPFELQIITKAKSLIYVMLSVKLMVKDNKTIRIVSMRDITEQKQIQQKILNTIIQTEENERRRVAQELHDGIGPILSTVKLYTQTYIQTKNLDFKQKIERQLITGIDEALSQVSTISNNLSPHVLKDFGIKVAIEKFIGRVQKVSNISVKFEYNYDGKIDDEIETTVYRVVIELINNTIKHAKATEISLIFDNIKEHVQLVYSDNGKGFDFEATKKTSSGMGLFNIVNRIKSFNGQVNFERGEDKGITYNIFIPAKLL